MHVTETDLIIRVLVGWGLLSCWDSSARYVVRARRRPHVLPGGAGTALIGTLSLSSPAVLGGAVTGIGFIGGGLCFRQAMQDKEILSRRHYRSLHLRRGGDRCRSRSRTYLACRHLYHSGFHKPRNQTPSTVPPAGRTTLGALLPPRRSHPLRAAWHREIDRPRGRGRGSCRRASRARGLWFLHFQRSRRWGVLGGASTLGGAISGSINSCRDSQPSVGQSINDDIVADQMIEAAASGSRGASS